MDTTVKEDDTEMKSSEASVETPSVIEPIVQEKPAEVPEPAPAPAPTPAPVTTPTRGRGGGRGRGGRGAGGGVARRGARR